MVFRINRTKTQTSNANQKQELRNCQKLRDKAIHAVESQDQSIGPCEYPSIRIRRPQRASPTFGKETEGKSEWNLLLIGPNHLHLAAPSYSLISLYIT